VGEILRDVGIAFCISVVIAAFVELNLAQETFIRGLDAIMKRTVPDEVWEEFRQHVITQQMMRKDWSITMKVQPADKAPFLSTTQVKYTIVALKDRLDTEVRHELDRHRDPLGGGRRFKSACGGGVPYDSEAALDAAKMLSGERPIQVPVKLLRHNDTLDVQIVFTESFDCPDVLVWWMNRTTENAAITVEGL